jgi:Arc/MetJ-type ribon-helix-helix transcriptional regulator
MGAIGGTIHAMKKTTVYLPDDLKQTLANAAVASGRSEAELIREAIRALIRDSERPRPKGALFASGEGGLAERVDEALVGFGEH